MSKTIFLTILLIIFLAVFGGIFFKANKSNKPAPEFSPTATITLMPSQSPTPVKNLTTEYITGQDWPPKVTTENKPFSCTEAGSVNAPAGQTKKKVVNSHTYCVTQESEGAAGSVYDQYAFARAKNGQTQIFTFTLRLVQCGNYPEPQMSQCQTERKNFDINSFMDAYITSNY